MNHFAGGHGNVAPQFERGRIGMGKLTSLEVDEQMLHPGNEVFALGLKRLLQNNRIGHREVGRA